MTPLDNMRMVVRCEQVDKAAALYAGATIPVIPLHTPGRDLRCSCRKNCDRDNGKHPRTINGLSDARTDIAKVDYWWRTWPDANIGLLTGILFWVLDVDGDEGGKSLDLLEQQCGYLPPTWRVRSGSGSDHFWFHYRTEHSFRNSAKKIGLGLDIRAAGGYVVAPPSFHFSGHHYVWSEEHSPLTVPLADAPAWLIRLAIERSSARTGSLSFDEDSGAIAEGERNDTLFRLGCRLRNAGLRVDEIAAALAAVNAARCKPPISDDEIVKIAGSTSAYQRGTPSLIVLPREGSTRVG